MARCSDSYLTDFLKEENCRISTGSQWLYWDNTNNEWVVLYRGYGQRKNRTLYSGDSLVDALKALKGD